MIAFQKKYTAFIDVLGFTELVNSDSQSVLETYFDALEVAFQVFDRQKKQLQKYSISDSIILIADDSEEQFKMLLEAVGTLQVRLAAENIWVRGGIAYGEVFCDLDRNIIVGKGYIRAYHLENEAIFPRIIIDPAILNTMNLNLQQFYQKYNGGSRGSVKLIHDYGFIGTSISARITPDDAIFVTYSHRIVDRAIEHWNAPDNQLQKIYNSIRKNLYGPQKHYQKYLWLKKYFSETILEYLKVGSLNNEQKVWLQRIFNDFSAL